MIMTSSASVIKISGENQYSLVKILKNLNNDDIVITGRKSFNTLILDEKKFPGAYRNFSMFNLSFAKKISYIPEKLSSIVMIFNRDSVIAKSFSKVEIRVQPLMPLKERIIWDTKSNYRFTQNLHILIFSRKMSDDRASEIAQKLDDKKMTREQLYSILAKEALDLYY
jgi:hypothetical protein